MTLEDNKVNILLVDDQPENLAALEATLADLNQNLIKAHSGREALKQCLDKDFAVILLDVQMPGLDGFETANLIRSRRRSSKTPIIFLTAMYIEDTYSAVAYALGAVDYLIKPFVPEVLRSKISVFVELFQRTEEARHQAELIRQMQQAEYEAQLSSEKARMEAETYRVKQELLKQELDTKLLEEHSKQLQESNRLKGEFLANMSHEIRTPMSAVTGMAELLLHTELDSDQREFATIIRDSAQALLTIINDILDLSKIEAGKLELDLIDFDLVPVVEGVAGLVSDEARLKQISLMTFVEPSLPPMLKGDAIRLRQILLNMISNAVKFTHEGEIILRAVPAIEPIDDAPEGSIQILFEVSDTGIGIAEDKIDKLFHAFTQADGSTTRKYGGTGLGLSISKRLVEMMGGKIGVRSVEGQGSTFWANIPFTPVALPEVEELRLPLGDLKILVVDDHTMCSRIIQGYLSFWGMRCDCVQSGPEALQVLRKAHSNGDPYKLIIIDLMMPVMDGFALAEIIRSDKNLASMKRILLTAYDEKGQGPAAVKAGFSSYLTKPVKASRLRECISRVIYSDDPDEIVPATKAPASTEGKPIILIAEDNEINQHVTQLQLRRLGYESHVVSTGKDAAKEALSGRYALVLMDCHMPEMDGFEATGAIRSEEMLSGKHLPIIGLTARAMAGDREACLSAGMDEYLTKPASLDQLEKTIIQNLHLDFERANSEVGSESGYGHDGTNESGRFGSGSESASGQQPGAGSAVRSVGSGPDSEADGSPGSSGSSSNIAPGQFGQNASNKEKNQNGSSESEEHNGRSEREKLFIQIKNQYGSGAVDEVFPVFLSSTRNLLNKMTLAIQERDQKALFSLAHQLKGSCNTIGANKLGMLGQKMETASSSKKIDWKKMSQYYQEVQVNFAKLEQLTPAVSERNDQ